MQIDSIACVFRKKNNTHKSNSSEWKRKKVNNNNDDNNNWIVESYDLYVFLVLYRNFIYIYMVITLRVTLRFNFYIHCENELADQSTISNTPQIYYTILCLYNMKNLFKLLSRCVFSLYACISVLFCFCFSSFVVVDYLNSLSLLLYVYCLFLSIGWLLAKTKRKPNLQQKKIQNNRTHVI